MSDYNKAVANACVSLARIYGEEYARHCDRSEADEVREARARRIALRVAQQCADGSNETNHWSWMTDPDLGARMPRGVDPGACNQMRLETEYTWWVPPNERGAA